MPNLYNGDFILVNKFSYGVRLPVANHKLWETDRPKRGDVAVFRFPLAPSTNYIKRVIGVPGDRVVYKEKRLTINGQPVELTDPRPYFSAHLAEPPGEVQRVAETVNGTRHDILLTARPDYGSFDIVVPPGQYFAMGDNRDHSNDSRVWGYVPDENLVGRAFLIWFSLDTVTPDRWFWQRILWSRIGDSIH
jgi:signal peptidase I